MRFAVTRLRWTSAARVPPWRPDRLAELDFVPNANAQQLARADRTAVGVIVHDVSDPYFAEITRGLQRVATDAGRLLFICNTYRDPDKELEYVELLRAHQGAARRSCQGASHR